MHHDHHDQHSSSHIHVDKRVEYLKFTGIMLAITILATIHSTLLNESSAGQFTTSFMGVFFVVFAGFKLGNLKEFAYGFQSYDVLAKKSLAYSFAYPFLQLLFGILYLFGATNYLLDGVVLLISLFSGLGVLRALGSHAKVHCVCLGNVVKLPLSTISFVEDFGMAAMATIMLLY